MYSKENTYYNIVLYAVKNDQWELINFKKKDASGESINDCIMFTNLKSFRSNKGQQRDVDLFRTFFLADF